jgi:type IV secretion system protein VirB10
MKIELGEDREMAEQNNSSNYFVPDFADEDDGGKKKVKNSPKSTRVIWIVTAGIAVLMGMVVFSMDSRRGARRQTEPQTGSLTAEKELRPAVGLYSDSEAIREAIYKNLRDEIVAETTASDDLRITAAPVITIPEPPKTEKNVRIVQKPASEALERNRQMASAAFSSDPQVSLGGLAAPDDGEAETETSQATGDDYDSLLSQYAGPDTTGGGTAAENLAGTALAPETGVISAGGGTIAQQDGGDSNATSMAHQDRANQFAAVNTGRGANASDEYISSSRRAPVSRYELKAGSIISGVMVGGINSDLPGTIIGQVTENVYDTATGAYLLIPQGARMVGAYDSHVVYGQNRIMVVWNRIIFPDGTSLNLEGMLGSDQRGYAGFKQKVDHHYSRLLGAAIFASVFVAAGKEATKDDRATTTNSSGETRNTESIFAESVMENVTNIATEMIEKNLNIAPTLRILPGYRFSILTAKDVMFAEPYTVGGANR